MACLLLTSVAMVIIPGVLVGRMRDALTAAERKLFLQAWYLSQLVPSKARPIPWNVTDRIARDTAAIDTCAAGDDGSTGGAQSGAPTRRSHDLPVKPHNWPYGVCPCPVRVTAENPV